MYNALDPRRLSAAERLDEIADFLAASLISRARAPFRSSGAAFY
jgi:hypothetical protein